MVNLNDFISIEDSKGRKTKRYRLYCSACKEDRGYGMKTRADMLCKKCMTKNNHLEECGRIAISKGGKLLSTEWKGSTDKYDFQCGSCNDIWSTYSYVVRRGSWCPSCSKDKMAKDKRKKDIQYCNDIASKKGGTCLSTVYKNDATKYDWLCSQGHKWSTRLSVIEEGCWCPTCADIGSRYKKEEIVRSIFESYFSKSFPKSRPDWLINPLTGYKMELDGYCEELKLAFEYDGELHSKGITFFNNNVDLQKNRDIIKDELCKKENIRLIRVNYKDKNRLEKTIMELLSGIL